MIQIQKNITGRHPLPFRYPGGKYYALDIIRPFYEGIAHDEYREPFVGGGTIFFNKSKVTYNWVNDIDEELMITYKIMSNPKLRQELADKLSGEEASKTRWGQIRHFDTSNDLEIAYRYYYMNRTSFSGKLSSPAWGYRPKRSLPPERWCERIIPCGQKLEGVKITCGDFEDVILKPAQGEKVLMFVDPPYFSPPKNKHYRNGFNLEDHHRLCKALRHANHKFVLTYDDVPEIRKLYKWANVNELNFFYRVDNSSTQNGKRRIGFELIITNYDTPHQFNIFSK